MDGISVSNSLSAEELLAIEGYQFYSAESLEFAAISAGAFAAALKAWDAVFAQPPVATLGSYFSDIKINQEQDVDEKGA
jgi:hypothetical protein